MYKNSQIKQKTTTDQKKVQVRKGNGNIQMIKRTTRRQAELSVHKSTSDKSQVKKIWAFTEVEKHPTIHKVSDHQSNTGINYSNDTRL